MAEEVSNEQPQVCRNERALVFECYTKRHEVVLKKIGHARTATRQAVGASVSVEKNVDRSALGDLTKYDRFWEELIALFKEAGMSFDGLNKIEEVLRGLPTMIKKYYEVLVKQDRRLLMLLKELTTKKYDHIWKALDKVKHMKAEELLSFCDIDAYRSENAKYILKRVSMLPQ